MTTDKAAAQGGSVLGGPRLVSAAALTGFTAAALRAIGLPAADAARVAGLMIEADLVGADAHGIFRLPHYARRMQAGAVNPTPQIKVTRTAAATALVDGDNGMGHLVMSRAADTAIEMARDAGVAWVGARMSNHAGPASIYAAMPLKAGMIGIYAAVASANHMAPWGGVDSLLGTNPLAIAVPAGDEPPVLLDIATTVVSYGTVKNYAMQGKTMPTDWMVSRETGAPLTDPKRSGEGILLPIGGYKGSGLALVLGLLAGTLNGAVFGRDVIDFNADQSSVTNTGHFVVAIDIGRFIDPKVFAAEVDRHVRDLRGSARLPGVESIRLPGEERTRRHAARSRDGVPIPAPLVASLDELGLRLGVGPLPQA